MARPRLHLDADASRKALHAALLVRGHDVTRTPNEWMPFDANDETQLLGATAHGRCIFTFNIADFVRLARRYPNHAGIVMTNRANWALADLITALDQMLSTTQAADWVGQARWLNEWR